jgi:hypothetical protein
MSSPLSSTAQACITCIATDHMPCIVVLGCLYPALLPCCAGALITPQRHCTGSTCIANNHKHCIVVLGCLYSAVLLSCSALLPHWECQRGVLSGLSELA